jgi:hypothetical protein
MPAADALIGFEEEENANAVFRVFKDFKTLIFYRTGFFFFQRPVC